MTMAAAAAAAHQARHHCHGHGHHGHGHHGHGHHGHGNGHHGHGKPGDEDDKPKLSFAQELRQIIDADNKPAGWRKHQPAAQFVYNSLIVQVFVAGLIVFNFLVNILQAQIDPSGTKYVDEFVPFEWFFNIVFLIELVLNMYGHWFKEFWSSGWNVFDFTVVVIGWLFQCNVPLPGPMKLLRMMRAFRVFRLFKRVESLRKILNSLARAIPGVANAFLIQLIVMCIYAIIAVDRFHDYGENKKIANEYGETFDYATARQQDFGFEYFGDFGKSLYTMFQVLTGESWSEAIARPLFNSDKATTSIGACFFFVSFQILCGVILVNVVVAVLLEKMVDEEPSDDDGSDEGSEDGDYYAKSKDLEQIKTDIAEMKQQLADVTFILLQTAPASVRARLPSRVNGTDKSDKDIQVEEKEDKLKSPIIGKQQLQPPPHNTIIESRNGNNANSETMPMRCDPISPPPNHHSPVTASPDPGSPNLLGSAQLQTSWPAADTPNDLIEFGEIDVGNETNDEVPKSKKGKKFKTKAQRKAEAAEAADTEQTFLKDGLDEGVSPTS